MKGEGQRGIGQPAVIPGKRVALGRLSKVMMGYKPREGGGLGRRLRA